MALDFPNAPTNGQIYTDAGTGEQWVYEAATNSWTSKGLVNTTGGLQYKGDTDITKAPPTGATSGSQYSVNPGGTANAGFGPGVTGNVSKGSMLMYTGTGWIETSHAVPEATPLVKGIDTRKWNRTGTVLSPATAGDVVNISAGTAALPGLTPVSDPNTGVYSPGADQIGIATNGVGRLLADATGGITIPALKSASVANVAVDINGKLIRQALPSLPFTWDANDDSYSRVPVADRSILVQARVKRCLVTDAGVVTYLDADDSTKLAGDWVRLVETTDLDTPYTGTHQAEQANTELRALASAWAAGTFTKGALVSDGGIVWECVAATTTAAPAAGTAAATLDGTAGQVMVEIPLFSVKHQTERNGTYKRHEFAVAPGAQTTGGFAVHPAFIKPDGSYRDFTYVGAYQGTGTGGNGSASGVNNTVNITRAACRTACSGRGVGWHQLGYWENNALQWLLITEYQDMNSQKVLGNGATGGSGVYEVPGGLSNARGNRSGNVTAGKTTDYISYRGVENFFGRAWQWLDGINLHGLAVYLSNNPAQWADDTSTNYTASGSVPSGSASYQRDVMTGIALLPSSATGASGTTFIGDSVTTGSGWATCFAAGRDGDHTEPGAFALYLGLGSTAALNNVSARLCWSA